MDPNSFLRGAKSDHPYPFLTFTENESSYHIIRTFMQYMSVKTHTHAYLEPFICYEIVSLKQITQWNIREEACTDLTGDSAAIKNRILMQSFIVRRMRMDINRIETFISFEKSLPERSQQHWPFSQKHECNLWFVFEGNFLNLWNQ